MILHGEYLVTEQFKLLWQFAPSNVEENNLWLCPIPPLQVQTVCDSMILLRDGMFTLRVLSSNYLSIHLLCK